MKKTLLIVAFFSCMTTATAQKYVGGDISLLTKYEEAGVVYKEGEVNGLTLHAGYVAQIELVHLLRCCSYGHQSHQQQTV